MCICRGVECPVGTASDSSDRVSFSGRPLRMPQKNKVKHYPVFLTVFCPNTRTSIPTTIATDLLTLTKLWHSKLRSHVLTVRGPHLQSLCSIRRSGTLKHTPLTRIQPSSCTMIRLRWISSSSNRFTAAALADAASVASTCPRFHPWREVGRAPAPFHPPGEFLGAVFLGTGGWHAPLVERA